MGSIDSLRKTPRRRFLKALTLLFSLLGCLVLAEILLRLFLPLHFISSNENYMYDEELGFRAKPGHSLVLKDYQQELYVNPLGTINFQRDFKDYEQLVFALGDSYTQGTGLYSDANYPFQLDLLLNLGEDGAYRKKLGVVNLGLSAFGGEQSLIALKRYIRLLGKPSIVLYLGCDNDYSDDLWFKSGAAHKNILEGNPYWGNWYHPVKWIFVDLEIGKRLKYLVSLKRLATVRHAGGISPEAAREKKKETRESPKTLAEMEIEVIRRIIQTAEENGARVILSWANPSRGYRFLKSWAKENGYPFADWVPAKESVLQAFSSLPAGNPHSGGHYRTWVNQLIARAYYQEIEKIQRSAE